MTTTNRFISIFDINAPEQSVRKIAIAAVRAGYAVVPIKPLQKKPNVCTLNARELKEAGKHKCGVYHAITEEKDAQRIFLRLEKQWPTGMGLGIVSYPSRMISIDADVISEVEAFQKDWANNVGGLITPTVESPGMQDEDGEWKHKDGGHFHFRLPDGIDLEIGRGYIKAEGGYIIKWGMSMFAVPPTIRKEGPYVARGNVMDAPEWLIKQVTNHTRSYTERKAMQSAMFANDSIAQWAGSVSWDELLVPDGWTNTGKLDSCGCPIFERPEGGATSYKSATGHESDCDEWPNVENHGPLHIWTDYPPAPLDEYIRDRGRTLTKLTYVAVVHHGGDTDAAKIALGITPDMSAFWSDLEDAEEPRSPRSDGETGGDRDDREGDAVTAVQGSDRDDLEDREEDRGSRGPAVLLGVGIKTAMSPEGVAPRSDSENDTDSEGAGEPEAEPRSEPTADDRLKETAARLLAEHGLPERFAKKLGEEIAAAAVRMLASDGAERFIGRAPVAGADLLSSWMPPETFIADFLAGVEEPPPAYLKRTDGTALLYRGRVNQIVGRKAGGKTWLAIVASAEVLEAGGRVLYFDMEDGAQSWRSRFNTLGVDIDRHVSEGRAVWVKPGDIPVRQMEPVVDYAAGFDLVVFDVTNRLITRLGGTPDSGNKEVMWLSDNLFDPIANRGPAVLILDHPNRRGQRSDATVDDLQAGGGAMKGNNLSGISILMKPVKAFTRSDPSGKVELICGKDRPGFHPEGGPIGTLIGSLGASNDRTILELRIIPASEESDADREARELSVSKKRITEILKKYGKQTKAQVKKLMSKEQARWFDVAVAEMVILDGTLLEDGKHIDLKPAEGPAE